MIGPIVSDAFPLPHRPYPSGANTPVADGAVETVYATLEYAAPPSPAIVGIPYSLQSSTNGGAWTVLTGGSGNSGTTGLITGSVTVPAGKTVQIRLFTPTFGDTPIATQFSPKNNQSNWGSFTAP